MSETTNLNIRIDRELKEEAERIFNALGMNISTAFNVFVRQAVRQRKIPFEIALDSAASVRELAGIAERIWEEDLQNGADTLTMEEIDAEIAAARAERAARATPELRPGEI